MNADTLPQVYVASPATRKKMTISILATVVRALWFLAEMLHAARHKVTPDKDWDRSSLKILKAATLALPVGAFIGFTAVGHIQTAGNFIGSAGLALMLAGICIRWIAINTLGRYFTRTVTLLDDHCIIQNGLYRHLRHPSYTGYLLGNLGFGLAFSNWLSALIIFAPIAAAVFYRIHVEERALVQKFGNEYFEYAARTKRLIPMVY